LSFHSDSDGRSLDFRFWTLEMEAIFIWDVAERSPRRHCYAHSAWELARH